MLQNAVKALKGNVKLKLGLLENQVSIKQII